MSISIYACMFVTCREAIASKVAVWLDFVVCVFANLLLSVKSLSVSGNDIA